MRLVLVVALLGSWMAAWGADSVVGGVVRTPPEVYTSRIARQLTKLEDVLPGRTAFPDDKSGGIVLLNECIVHRGPDGLLYRVYHFVYHVADQSSVKEISSDLFTFDRERESIFLVHAATILPDGRRQDVENGGAFIQTPQRAADQSLYTSEAELNVIYPKIAPGASTESIIVIRENTPVMPGHFAQRRSFGGGWPTYLQRFVVELPDADWKRVRVHNGLPGVPAPAAEPVAGKRERRVWTARQLPRVPWEEYAPGFAFRVPTLWLSTVGDWNDVAAWFEQLVAKRSDLGPDLEAAVDEWTRGRTDPRDIVNTLLEKVANEVRYTGLEFGLAGYQPQPCRDVWKNRYGDCKDKANLLRAMLARKGIPAYVALLDTDAHGRIEKASPSWQQFDHAILAVAQPDGGYLFCDPTVKHLPAGVLPIANQDRDVLVVRAGRADWVRTPDPLGAAIDLDADVALAADGSLSGWFTFATTGSDAAFYGRYFGERDRDDRVRALQKYVEQFFPGAEVMDTDIGPVSGLLERHQARAYFVRPAHAASGESLKFPFPADWLPQLNTVGERRFPYAANRRAERLNLNLALPPGWTARSLPKDFSAGSGIAQFNAQWRAEPGRVRASLAWWPERTTLAPADYAVYQRAVRALRSWLEQPAWLAPDGSAPAAAPAPAPDGELADFPILPTGAGQLRLLEEKFPEGDLNAKRRLALQKVIQWFPNDTETVFTALVKLAVIEWTDENSAQVAADVHAALERYRPQLTPVLIAWAEFLEAKSRWLAHQDPAGLATLRRLAHDETLPPFRRGWAAHDAARYLAQSDEAAALEFLRPFARLDCEAQPRIIGQLTRLLAHRGDLAGYLALVQELLALPGEGADGLAATSIKELAEAWEKVPEDFRRDASAALAPLVADAGRLPKSAAGFAHLQQVGRIGIARADYARRLADYLEQHPPAWWKRPPAAPRATDVVIQEITARNDAADATGTLNPLLELILANRCDDAAFAKYARWTLWWLDHSDVDGDLLTFLGREFRQLPAATGSEICEGWNLLGELLGRRNQPDEARAMFERVLACPEALDYQRVEAGGELSLLELRLGRLDEALAAVRRIEGIHKTHRKGVDYLYPALLVHLERGDLERGLELIARIRQQDPAIIAKAAHGTALGHLLRAAADPAALRRYWAHAATWQADWDAAFAASGLKPAPLNSPPTETDWSALNNRLQKAREAKDKARLFRNLETYVRLARWIPLFTIDFAEQVNLSSGVSPELNRSLLTVLRGMTTGLEPVDPDFDAGARLWAASATADLGDAPRGAELARTLYQDLGLATSIGEAALRVWAMCTRGTPAAEEPERLLAAALAGDAPLHNRERCLGTLSDSYQPNAARADEHLALLERETARSDFNAKSSTGQILTARLKSMRSARAEGAALTANLDTWLAQQGLAWLDEAPPHSLDDPRFRSYTAPMTNRVEGVSSSERVKFNLLLARDANRPAATRFDAFEDVVFMVALQPNRGDAFARIKLAGAALPGLPMGSRINIVDTGLMYLLRRGLDTEAEPLRKDAAFAAFQPDSRLIYDEWFETIAALRAGRLDDALAIARRIGARPIGPAADACLQQVLAALVRADRAADAEQLLKELSGVTVTGSWIANAKTLRLQWSRLLRQLRVQELFRGKLAAGLRPGPAPEGDGPRLLYLYDLSQFTERESLALAHRLLTEPLPVSTEVADVLRVLFRARQVLGKQSQIGLDLAAAALALTGEDAARAQWFPGTAALCDPDLPEVREKLTAMAEQFLRDPQNREANFTRAAVAQWLAYLAIRHSTEDHPHAVFERLNECNVVPDTARTLRLAFFQSRGKTSHALALIDLMEADQLATPFVYERARPVLLAGGRQEEVELLDETARAKITSLRWDTELCPWDHFAALQALELARLVGSRDALPAAWYERVRNVCRHETDQRLLAVAWARAGTDWHERRAAAQAMLDRLPDYYEIYFDRGLAAWHLGDRAAARADLRIFLDHARDSEFCPEARALLETPDDAPPAR